MWVPALPRNRHRWCRPGKLNHLANVRLLNIVCHANSAGPRIQRLFRQEKAVLTVRGLRELPSASP